MDFSNFDLSKIDLKNINFVKIKEEVSKDPKLACTPFVFIFRFYLMSFIF